MNEIAFYGNSGYRCKKTMRLSCFQCCNSFIEFHNKETCDLEYNREISMMIIHPPINPGELPAYHIVTANKEGYALSSNPLDAHSDDNAISLALAIARTSSIDLWDGLRFIGHFGSATAST